jgi:probable HAF family extracellular repeat protein
MRRLGSIFALVVVTVVLGQSGAALGGPIPSFRGLGDLPGGTYFSRALGVSGDGRVVVGGVDAGDGGPFRWTEVDGFTHLQPGADGGILSTPFGVNGDGSVIAGLKVNTAQRPEAFRWTAETGAVGLGDFPGGDFQSTAYDVSGDGEVVVGYGSIDGSLVPFRWTQDDGLTPLELFPNGGGRAYGVSVDGSVIVGEAVTSNGLEAVRWVDGEVTGLGDLPGGAFLSRAQGVTADGKVIVGDSQVTPGGLLSAFRWTSETGMVGIGEPANRSSVALAASADGSVIVGRAAGFASI